MEFGPRALGHRSILADPRDARMKDLLNEKVKRRESFRPFAPAVIEERAADYFDMTGLGTSPFMLFTVPVREDKRATIPAVTHVDGTARVQTVSRDTDPLFWSLISAFGRITGIPVVLNTSYNVRNEPIVCTPADALRCFLGTEIDCAALGEYFVEKLQ
jgi:carbamoyltransferase